MKWQTRAFMIREKQATFVTLVDTCNIVKDMLYNYTDIGDSSADALTDLWVRMERRIFEHMPSNIEEAEIKREFLNGVLQELKEKKREVDQDESLALLQSTHRLGSFYRSYYNHAVKRIEHVEGKK
ncbi:MAG: hypothetical protein COV35_07715 [Alphaproteobacteria bacterium CG11_big_fil_rev_8_21_14_0_20_39_49]|nr:MAG: hypothetical protein COV35_07715 [Alphaproteobacteria bacterium CG11_big_fil_rev_8_21_14_0_20_39_49]